MPRGLDGTTDRPGSLNGRLKQLSRLGERDGTARNGYCGNVNNKPKYIQTTDRSVIRLVTRLCP